LDEAESFEPEAVSAPFEEQAAESVAVAAAADGSMVLGKKGRNLMRMPRSKGNSRLDDLTPPQRRKQEYSIPLDYLAR
jgi:hypothetical protein